MTPQRLPNPKLVGRPATYIAQTGRHHRAANHARAHRRVAGVGRDYPLSIEKLCPVLSFYVVNDWRDGCERCKEILRYGGMGHTMSIHSRNDDIILRVRSQEARVPHRRQYADDHRVDRATTGLDPSMTLGCGGYGGNITSDNISPLHLLNIKRLAYETNPATCAARPVAAASAALPKGPRAPRGARRHRRGAAGPPD